MSSWDADPGVRPVGVSKRYTGVSPAKGGIAMKADTISVRVVTDGTFLLDGGSVFGQVPRVIWEREAKPDRKNRVRLGLNCLLVRTPEHNLLIDVGIGSKNPEVTREVYGLTSSKLLRNLKGQGLMARDVDMVLLTHLHFDHCGGAVRLDRVGQLVPTFPNAKYMVQRAAWDEAYTPNERAFPQFGLIRDVLHTLDESGQIEMIDGDTEIIPGVESKVTDGHCAGHQSVFINTGGERIAYLGDLVPTASHVNLSYITAFDKRPDTTLEQKREYLSLVEREGWLVVFPHGYEHRAGYLERWGSGLNFRSIPV